MTETLLGRNLFFNYIGLISALIFYCYIRDDPSMTGWYFTFGTFPIVFLPQLNRYILLNKVWKETELVIQGIYCLICPLIFLLPIFKQYDLVFSLMFGSMLFVNIITLILLRKNRI